MHNPIKIDINKFNKNTQHLDSILPYVGSVWLNLSDMLMNEHCDIDAAKIIITSYVDDIKHDTALYICNNKNKFNLNTNIESKLLTQVINSTKYYGYFRTKRINSVLKGAHKDVRKDILLHFLNCKDITKITGNTYYDMSSGTAIKWIARKILEVVETDSDRIKYINKFYKHMTPGELKSEIEKLPDKFNTKALKISKNSQYSMLQYSSQELQNSKTKSKIVGYIVKSDSAIKYLSHSMSLTKQDLEDMPPVRRLDFLEWYFNDYFYVMDNLSFSSQKRLTSKISARRKKGRKNQNQY